MLLPIDPTERLRAIHRIIGGLGIAGQLTPEGLKDYLADAAKAVDALAEQVRDDEHFEITLDGLSALHKGGKPTRYRGRLVVIDGDRP